MAAKKAFNQERDSFTRSGLHYYGDPTPNRTGLPIYDSFPEFEVDNWSEETRARGCTKRKNTYLYDSRKQGNGGMYSDRMWQWDAAKAEAALKLLVNGWRCGDPAQYNAMLRAYLDKQVAVTQVIHMIDGRGYDMYYIAWHEPKPAGGPTLEKEETGVAAS